MKIDEIKLRLLRVGLTQPYKLSFGTVEGFDTLLVEVMLSDGQRGIGEATILTGYTDETLEQCWTAAREIAPNTVHLDASVARLRVLNWVATNPFTATAFATAFDMAFKHPTLSNEECRVPILGVINTTDIRNVDAEVERLLASGYRTLKVKVGWEVNDDLRRVQRVQRAIAGTNFRIRIDANQGYSPADGVKFASELAPDGVELFEQPCHADDWDAAVAVMRVATVPMMLDESIYKMTDVEKAAQLGAADVIKLKLMKLGNIDRLEQALDRITVLGMRSVLGDGVATEIGCWMEACVSGKRQLQAAGEMNGFLKQKRSTLKQTLRIEGGCIVIPRNFVPELDLDAIKPLLVAGENYLRR